MNKEFTCILCPNGCTVAVEYEEATKAAGTTEATGTTTPKTILSVTGNLCGKGEAYAKQELLDPQRSVASVVTVEGGQLPLASVRLSKPIPKDRIFAVMAEIRKQKLQAPVHIGQVVIKDILGTGSDLIATKNIPPR